MEVIICFVLIIGFLSILDVLKKILTQIEYSNMHLQDIYLWIRNQS